MAGPSQHLGTPILLPRVFIEQLTERERPRTFSIASDCRGHDRHNPRKDCSIAPDSYRTGLGSQRSCKRSIAHLGVVKSVEEGLDVSSPMEGTAHVSSNRSITRQKTVQHIINSSVWQVGVKPSGGTRQEQSSKLSHVYSF